MVKYTNTSQINKSNLKAFSLVETLITLAVFGVLLAMLSQVLLLNIRVAAMVAGRSKIREELSQVSGLIQRDLRNIDRVGSNGTEFKCGEYDFNNNGNPIYGCEISVKESTYLWVDSNHDACGLTTQNNKRICKLDIDENVIYQTSDNLNIENFVVDFQGTNAETTQATILVTILSSAANPSWKVNSQVRQISTTTRNL